MRSILARAFYNESPESNEPELDQDEIDELREEYVRRSPAILDLLVKYAACDLPSSQLLQELNTELERIEALAEETAHERATERATYANADD